MKVTYTARARRDLVQILHFTAAYFPAALAGLTQRLRRIEAQIADWPESAPLVEDVADVRMIPLGRYPFKLFYAVRPGGVEILYIHHVARNNPP